MFLVISRVKKITISNMGELGLEKMQNHEYVFGKKHVKLAHGRNFAPKIFPDHIPCISFRQLIHLKLIIMTFQMRRQSFFFGG